MCKFQKDWMNNKKGQNFQRPPNKVFDCRFSIKKMKRVIQNQCLGRVHFYKTLLFRSIFVKKLWLMQGRQSKTVVVQWQFEGRADIFCESLSRRLHFHTSVYICTPTVLSRIATVFPASVIASYKIMATFRKMHSSWWKYRQLMIRLSFSYYVETVEGNIWV